MKDKLMLLEIDAKYYELRYRIKMWLTYVRNLNVRKVFFFPTNKGQWPFPQEIVTTNR